MAVQELRKFNFFDLQYNVDKTSLASILKDTSLTVTTCGHNFFIFGDAEGNLILLNKLFEPIIFKAFNISISHGEYIKHSSYLVTVGEDDPGVNPLLKVWNLDLTDKSGLPKCVRVTRLIPNQKAVSVTAVGVHENANYLAFGFVNGSVLLYRGDVARDRSNKPKLLETGNSSVTGLAFRIGAKFSLLFVTTDTHVYSYDITIKDKEIKFQLDTQGCAIGCSTMAELPHEAHFVVARNDAVYCYTADGKGPCTAIEGKKKMIQWSKSFLLIVTDEEQPLLNPMATSGDLAAPATNNTLLKVLDFHNNFIVFSSYLPEIASVVVECGSFYVITNEHSIHHLVEKDVQSKLALLFKKNLYDVAIRMAKNQHYDEDGLIDIFRQYGDHLNSKGDRAGAIEQYIKTIGKLEPSYIIRKFMDSAHMEQLMEYLQALHRKELATGDHTTLLLNCYIKLGRATELKDFIMTKGKKVDFDIEIALKVVRGVNSDDALSLAKAHGCHIWVLRILIEDLKKYHEAISYMSKLGYRDAEKCILDFGGILMDHTPKEMTTFLKDLFTKHKDSQIPQEDLQLYDYDQTGPAIPRPENFLHLFLLKSEYLVEFLEHLINSRTDWDTQIYNSLIEHCLVLWKNNTSDNRLNLELRLIKLLQSPDVRYDKDHVFLLCQMYDFAPGRTFLYEENKMYYQVIDSLIEEKNYKGVLAACRRFGSQDPSIWVQALWSSTRQADTPQHVLSEILSVIEKERLQTPLLTLEALEVESTLGQARRYLDAILQAENELILKETELINKYGTETVNLKKRIHDIENNTVIFQGSRCSVCNRQLELPSIHFLCQHSYHQHCLEGYADNENECIICVKSDRVIRDMIKSQENNHERHEAFHNQLQKASDGFTVVADYFGRGVFNKVNIASSNAATTAPAQVTLQKPPEPAKEIPSLIREATSLIREVPFLMKDIPVIEKDEPLALSLSKTANFESYKRRSPDPSSELLSSSYKNPFEDDDDDDIYDESKNPFAEEAEKPTNPFDNDNKPDYYDDLNPFA